ncbi:thioredoxin-like protein [Melanogaster broomeanus]|nr:thioredoxin-like protein [Melanogaster broomeanus]
MSVFSLVLCRSQAFRVLSTLKTPVNCFATAAASPSLRQPLGTAIAAEKFVEDTIKSHKIVVFSKTHCPHCNATKNYFASNYPTEEVEVVALDTRNDMSEIQDHLLQKTGERTVPRTFINGTLIGGNSDLQGMLKERVTALIASG